LDDDENGMKVSISMNLFPINLVGKGVIRKTKDKNIQKGNRIILLYFHSKLDMGEKIVKMVKERDQRGVAMRPNKKVSSTNQNQHLGLR
jgi:hypothetical protein